MGLPEAIGLGAQVAGTAIQGLGARSMGRSEEALYEYNAALAEKGAEQKRLSTAEAQKLGRDEMRRTLAANRAAVGASGVQMRGSPAEHQLSVIEDYAYDISRTGVEGRTEAQRMESAAEIYRMQAKSARKKGELGFWSALIGGAGGIMSDLYPIRKKK